ncbi:MAG: T9SS type A sorting domain-containing protein [Bacteroidetes bacterium]|nr:T9SS type A sorting domain-containing protein [Bacteroidota bacterium]
MKKVIPGIIFISAFAFFSRAQSPDLIWANGSGSADFEMVRDMITDQAGNVISVGQFTNTVDFDPGPGIHNLTSNGASDIFIMKQDSDGNLLWAYNIGDYDSDAAYGVGVDALNNIYVTGVFRYEVDFDPGPGDYTIGYWGTNAGQVFLLKLNSDGDLTWVNWMGITSGTSQGLVITVEPNGQAIISGTFYGTVDFDPAAGTTNLTANMTTNYDIFLASYNTMGDISWAYGFGGTSGNNFPEDITLDVTNNIILTGSFGGTADLDPTAGDQTVVSQGYDDAFIMKLTSGGMFLWAKTIGSIWGDYGFATVADSNEDIYFTGSFRQDIDLDPGAGTANYSIGSNENTFLIKLSWNGTFVWAKTFENGYNRPRSVDLDENDNLYVVGGYSMTADFDPGVGVVNHTSSDNFDDVFMVKLDPDGLYQSSFTFGTTTDDRGEAISVVSSDEFYIAGFFNGTVDFNPAPDTYALTSNGSTDNFVARYGTCSLNLSVSTSGVTLTADQSGATYAWMDCNLFSTIGVTTQSLTPASDGDYAVIITQGGCKDTSTCYSVVGVGIDEHSATSIALFPNPAQSNLTIEVTEPIEFIQIFNSTGTLVQTEVKNSFSVENLPAGVYVLQVQTKSGISTARFVKE